MPRERGIGDPIDDPRKRLLSGKAVNQSLLISVAPAADHTIDFWLLTTASGMFLLSGLLAVTAGKGQNVWRPTKTTVFFMLMQLLLCLWLAHDAFAHLHTL